MADRTKVTWSVGELHLALNDLLEQAFGPVVWVSGELRSLSRSNSGHVYFDLVDPGDERNDAPRLAVTLFNGYRRKVNAVLRKAGAGLSMDEGTQVRICGELRSYEARSRIQLVMTGIDPTFTLGALTQRRERTLRALAAEGLLELNSRLAVEHPPLRLAVVTSRGSAAEADVLDELRSSGFGFEVMVLDARTQGADAETSLCRALGTAASLSPDVVLLVRGGGSRSDLGVFDSEVLGRMIAGSPVPVMTGIGHETDTTVADVVAHTSFKTPTACAAAMVDVVRRSADDLAAATGALVAASSGSLDRARSSLATATRTVRIACRGHLSREAHLVELRTSRLAGGATKEAARARAELTRLVDVLGPSVTGRLGRAEVALRRSTELVDAHDPQRLLARGWSITTDDQGRTVRSALGVTAGTRLLTRLRDGVVESVATGTRPTGPPLGSPLEGEDEDRG